MASPDVMLRMSMAFLQRNNPLEHALKGLGDGFKYITTFNSKMKLLKYKFYLAKEQMNRMESLLNENHTIQMRGNKLNRTY